MPAVNYNSPVYSSANPAVGNLFKSEFAQRQAEQQAYDELAKQDTERARIGANSALANAQLRQAQANEDRNYLFRLNDLQDRRQTGDENRALANRQLDIEQKYREGIVANAGQKQPMRTAAEIDAFNTDSETAANQLNSLYQSKLTVAQAAAKKAYDTAMANTGVFGIGTWGAEKAKKDYEQALANLPDLVLNQVQELAPRYFPQSSYRFDPVGMKFIPVRMGPSKTAPSASAIDDAGGAAVPFNMGGGTVTGESADQGTGEGGAPYTVISQNGARQLFPTRQAMDAAVLFMQGGNAALPTAPTNVGVTPVWNYQNGKLQRSGP